MRIYFDNSATTPIDPAVLEVLTQSLRNVYGNASSVHREGQAARRLLEDARDHVARLIGATPREIVFTSGGTESNNAAIFGALTGRSGGHVVATAIEHPSVIEAVAEAKRRGFETAMVPAGRSGAVSAERVITAIRPDTRLVAVMLANNETGVLQPVREIGEICRARGVHLHCDAVQAAGKIDIDVTALGVDTLAVSAHKLHAPKGIGALYVRKGVTLGAFLFGGAQERRRRAGTENVPLASAFGTAATLAMDNDMRARLASLRDRFEERLSASGIAHRVNGATEPRIPSISNVTFSEADAEGIVIGLDLAGVAVSTGSACSSGRVEPSHVLLAMGLTPEEAKSTVRFSFSRFNTDEEVDRVIELLQEIVPRSRVARARGSLASSQSPEGGEEI